MKLMIVGSGYVGLTTGACLAELGHEVVCVDRDADKIDGLRSGVVPIFEPGLDSLIARHSASGQLRFDTGLGELGKGVEAVFIAVGTPPGMTGDGADLSSVYAAAEALAEEARKDLVVVTKSTVPVGTGDRIAAILRARSPHPMSVASNPEFLREGSAIADFLVPDRIVIGVDDETAHDVLARVYAPLTRRGAPLLVVPRRAAELVKYASNCFLATKISFINEIADLCEAVDADVEDVAAGVGLDSRIGAAFLRAGPGYGGSCFPKDCDAFLATARSHGIELNVVSSAVRTNTARKNAMSRRVLRALEGREPAQSIVAVLGLTFKADTDDVRETPALAVIDGLKQAGATVRVFDPQGMEHGRKSLTGVEFCNSALAACAGADCLVIATEWQQFRALDSRMYARVMRGRTIVDLRNLLDHDALVSQGFVVHSIGRPVRRPAEVSVGASPWLQEATLSWAAD
jgi:UDPglucose 6-dehydrogenase